MKKFHSCLRLCGKSRRQKKDVFDDDEYENLDNDEAYKEEQTLLVETVGNYSYPSPHSTEHLAPTIVTQHFAEKMNAASKPLSPTIIIIAFLILFF